MYVELGGLDRCLDSPVPLCHVTERGSASPWAQFHHL